MIVPELFHPGLYYMNPFFGEVIVNKDLQVCRGPVYLMCPETTKIFIIRMEWDEVTYSKY